MDQILEEVKNGTFDPIKVFTGNKDKFLEVKSAMESITNNLPRDVCAKFTMTKIVPTVFNKTLDNTVRDEAVEIGLHFLQFVNISLLDPKEQEDVFITIEDKYIKLIGELRDSNYPNWDKLWIFLIKLCSEKLHSKMAFANKLLRILEVAFRNNTSIEQRLKAYDCWIEFINNSSLNIEHMCCAKQIKLLVTPLKAKFSRIPVVMMKRCDTFVYLLEKLQDKATLCLKEFLEFCFGPFDEKNNVEKMRQSRSVPEVCNKSTKVLLDLIGHSHDAQANCLESDLRLYKPLINDANFPNFAEILINSVIECCILLNEWSQDSSLNNNIIKCLWRSLLKLVQNSNEDVKKKSCIHVNNGLKKLLEYSQHKEPLYTILGNIIDTLIKDEIIEKLNETVFNAGLSILCQTPTELCSFDVENVVNFLISCFGTGNDLKCIKIASDYFKNGVKCDSVALCDIWLKCNFTLGPENVAILIWPVRHLKNFKDIEALNSKWTKLYSDGTPKIVIIQEMEKLFHNNPLLGSNIVHFLELMLSAETNPGKDFVAKFMRLVELILTLPNLPDSDKKKLASMVLSYCNQTKGFYKFENNDEAIDKLCGCLEHLVSIHKDYTVLTELTSHLKNGQPKILLKFSKRLMSFLETLMLNEDNAVANSTRKLIELLEVKENEPDTISLTSSRSLRIVNMANVTPKSKKIVHQTNNLNLFSRSPLSLKSNRVASSPRNKTATPDKKKVATVSINEDKSSDYVKIETEVKINLDNLNEHQKEVLKRRREDIPALYQDLTQSQSQDFFEKDKDPESDSSENKQAKSPSPSKKRKRNDDDETEHINKIRNITEDVSSNNKREEIFETEHTTNMIETKISENPVSEKSVIEDVVDSTNETKETTLNGEAMETQIQSNAEIKTEESQDTIEEDKKTSPKSSRKNSPKQSPPDKSVRKSKRHTKSLREELDDAVKKQLEQFREEAKNEKQIEQDTSLKQIQTEEKAIKKEENGGFEEKEDNKTEKTIRKSARQVQKRNSDYLQHLARKSTSQETENQDDSLTRKNKKKQKSKSKEVIELEESFEELLERVDKRIEERKKNDKKLMLNKNGESPLILRTSDGNQNEINPLESKNTDAENANEAQNVNLKDNKKDRFIAQAKRRIQPSTNSLPSVANANSSDNQLSSTKPIDVYEFKAEDESSSSSETTKKLSRKKKRGSMAFSRSDYISKRRKKPRKERKEEGFPFHVTADSPLPLSESPSLRAVSSQEKETITILITRSPVDSSKETKCTAEHNSEDIIESSQETPADATKRRSSLSKIKSKGLKQPTIEEAIKPLLNTVPDSPRRRTRSAGPPENDENTPVITETIAELPEVVEQKINPLPLQKYSRRLSLNETSEQDVKVGKRNKRSISLDKLECVTEVTFQLKPENSEIVETPHVRDTSADTLTCESAGVDTQETTITDTQQLQLADTLTLSSPVKTQTKEDLPSSPVTCDTPDRTSELLNNTFDISPISSAHEDEMVTPTPKQSANEVSSLRVARLLQMVNSNVQVSNEGRRWFGTKHSSPSTSRVRKMRLKKEENLDILTFSREVPSPLTLPASGILKRKHSSADDSPAPTPKRKRVNFSDPAITDKKIFIRDADEFPSDQTCESTNDELEDINDKTSGGFLSAFGREREFGFKDFCDFELNLKDIALDSSRVESVFKLLQNLKAPEIAKIITEFINSSDSATVETICHALIDNGISTQIIDKCILPMVQNSSVLEEFLPKLTNSIEKLSNENLERLVHEVARIGEENRISKVTPTEISQKQIEEHVVNLDCDKMNDLIKTYFMNLQDQKRNDFLVDLMNLASSELPVNKEYVNCHVNILQNFVKKMTD